MSSSRISIETVDSSALAHNPLNDPSSRQMPVYLPPGYDDDANSGKKYPVVFLLAGFTGKGANLLGESAWEETIQQRMDRLIGAGSCRPMILVMPDCFTRYGGSQYLNSPAVGNYKEYLLELVGVVDSRFRTISDRDHRAIAGKSSGGYGAMMMGMQHPEVFGLVADHSGDKYFELCYKPDIPKFLRAQNRHDLAKLLENPSAIRPRGGDFFHLISVAAMAACYSPNPDSALGFDLPFDTETGELRDEVWKRWEALDPVNLAESNAEALKSLRLLLFDCGTRDEFNLLYGCRILKKKFEALGIQHQYEEFGDGHRSIQYRYDVSLPLISSSMPA